MILRLTNDVPFFARKDDNALILASGNGYTRAVDALIKTGVMGLNDQDKVGTTCSSMILITYRCTLRLL